MSHDAPTTRPKASKTALGRFVVPGAAVALAISGIQLLFMFCLSYPPLNTEPKHVPLGVVGPAPAVGQISSELAAAGKDVFDVKTYADADAARAAIKDRDIYGSFIVEPTGAKVLISSAANAEIAKMLKARAATTIPGHPARVDDVVPASKDDPNGSGYLTTTLPLTLLSLALGIVVAMLERGRLRAAGWIAMAATITAVFASWIAHGMGTFTDNYWATLGILALLVFGIATTSAGLTHLGRTGRATDLVFALLLLCIGIPGAGALTPSLLLVEPWRTLGPLLPPGAAVDALRSVNFFDGAAIGKSLSVLIVWVAIGLAIALLPMLRRQSSELTERTTLLPVGTHA